MPLDQGGHDREHHAERAELVAAHRGPRMGEPLEVEDEEDRRDEVDDVDEVLHTHVNPPPSSLEHLEHAVGDQESADHVDGGEDHRDEGQDLGERTEQACPSSAPARIRAPTIVMPEIAFEPDISGVCSVGGTLVMISKPTKIASTKTVISMIRLLMSLAPFARGAHGLANSAGSRPRRPA